jgi:hypothetical protein
MIEAYPETKTVYVMRLEPRDATLLKAVMQNPLYGEAPEDEEPELGALRRSIFESLRLLGVP